MPSADEVNDVPDNFKKYIVDNAERIDGWSSVPCYIKDNKEYVEIAKLQEGGCTFGYDSLKEQRSVVKGMVRPHSIHIERFEIDVELSSKNIKEWLNQPHENIMEKNEALLYIDKILQSAKYVGNGRDEHNASVVMHLFETKLNGKKSWIIVRHLPTGEYKIHSISDNESILRYVEKRSF